MPLLLEQNFIPTIFSDEEFFLYFIVDIYPTPITSQYRYFDVRLTVDSTDIPVKSYSYEENDQIAGNLNIELARHSDRSLITRASSIKFEKGEKISGVWQCE